VHAPVAAGALAPREGEGAFWTFYEFIKLKEIGKYFDIGESGASQIW